MCDRPDPNINFLIIGGSRSCDFQYFLALALKLVSRISDSMREEMSQVKAKIIISLNSLQCRAL